MAIEPSVIHIACRHPTFLSLFSKYDRIKVKNNGILKCQFLFTFIYREKKKEGGIRNDDDDNDEIDRLFTASFCMKRSLLKETIELEKPIRITLLMTPSNTRFKRIVSMTSLKEVLCVTSMIFTVINAKHNDLVRFGSEGWCMTQSERKKRKTNYMVNSSHKNNNDDGDDIEIIGAFNPNDTSPLRDIEFTLEDDGYENTSRVMNRFLDMLEIGKGGDDNVFVYNDWTEREKVDFIRTCLYFNVIIKTSTRK